MLTLAQNYLNRAPNKSVQMTFYAITQESYFDLLGLFFVLYSFTEVFPAHLMLQQKRLFYSARNTATSPDLACVTTTVSTRISKESNKVKIVLAWA